MTNYQGQMHTEFASRAKRSTAPVRTVELFEQGHYHADDTDGFPEKVLNRKSGARFHQNVSHSADLNSFKDECGKYCKESRDSYNQKYEQPKREILFNEKNLEVQMEYARYKHEIEMLREKLRASDEQTKKFKSKWETKMEQKRNKNWRRRDGDMKSMSSTCQDYEIRSNNKSGHKNNNNCNGNRKCAGFKVKHNFRGSDQVINTIIRMIFLFLIILLFFYTVKTM